MKQSRQSKIQNSFDYPIRPYQYVGWNGQADLLGRIQINHQLELRRLLDRKIGWLRAFEDLSTYVAARRNRSLILGP